MHSPQSMQNLLLICAFLFRTRMASVGQRLMQLMQPLQGIQADRMIKLIH